MMDDYCEVFGAFKCRGRAPVFELVVQKGTKCCGLFDPLTSLKSIADASFRKAPIESTSVRWRTTTVKFLRISRIGVMLSCGYFESKRFQMGQTPGFTVISMLVVYVYHRLDAIRRRVIELYELRAVIPYYTARILFSSTR
jgi:hypothetical protein